MNKLLSIALSCICSISVLHVNAQNPPPFSHFYANPFQFNPSFIANNGYAEANLFYKKQWMGIENSPTSAALNIQAPVGRNVSLGLTAYTENTILLSTNAALLTFGYRARISQNQHLNFGLSAGMGFNRFDFDQLENTNDPVLANITQNNSFINGQFGISYRLKNLTVGFALPKLFQSQPNTIDSFNEIKFDAFKNKFASAAYLIKMKDISFTPTAIYRALDNSQDQWEGALIASYKNLFWIGGSYRSEYGLTGMVGINLKGLLRIGYAYEHPTGDIAEVTNGSHEIYLGARLGKRNREEEILVSKTDTTSLQQGPVHEELVITAKSDSAVQEIKNAEPIIDQPNKLPTEKILEEPKQETTTTYFVVLGVFKNKENADRKNDLLRREGLQTSVILEEGRNLYFIYVYSSPLREKAHEELLKIKQQSKYSDAWLYSKTTN